MTPLRSRRLACAANRQLRYPSEIGGWSVAAAVRHESTCLECQADASRHRQLMRGLDDMKRTTESMPYDLAAALDSGKVAMTGQFGEDELALRRRRSRTAIASAASIAAIGVAVAAGRRIRAS